MTRFALLLVAICATAQQRRFDGKRWWNHVEILAADDMEGRGTGTPGLERAEAYVVGELKKSGLAPAGTNGYYQQIGKSTRLNSSHVSISYAVFCLKKKRH